LRPLRRLSEREKVDLSPEILGRQVTTHLGGEARIAVAEDALDSGRIGGSSTSGAHLLKPDVVGYAA